MRPVSSVAGDALLVELACELMERLPLIATALVQTPAKLPKGMKLLDHQPDSWMFLVSMHPLVLLRASGICGCVEAKFSACPILGRWEGKCHSLFFSSVTFTQTCHGEDTNASLMFSPNESKTVNYFSHLEHHYFSEKWNMQLTFFLSY